MLVPPYFAYHSMLWKATGTRSGRLSCTASITRFSFSAWRTAPSFAPMSAPDPASAQRHRGHGVGAERVGAGVAAPRLVPLPAADHDAPPVAQPRRLDGRDRLLHRVEGEREEPAQADHRRLELADLIDEFRRRHVDADVPHLVAVDVEHESDDVLADVVQVALHGADQDAAELLRLPARAGLDQRLGQRADFLQHLPGKDQLGQEVLAALETLADRLHRLAAQLEHAQGVRAHIEQPARQLDRLALAPPPDRPAPP